MSDEFSAEHPYAKCNDCEVQLVTPAEATQHGLDTMAPVENEGGIIARGHSRTVINPTAEEQAQRKIDYVVDRAVEAFCEDLQRSIDRNELTMEEAAQGLRGYSDFADAWDDWVREGDDG